MEHQNTLGIYLSEKTATAVLISGHHGSEAVKHCFSVTVEGEEEDNEQSLIANIANGLAQKNMSFGDVYVGLDCAMFSQHNLRSDFTEAKQIAQTIKFDIEEAVATDATDMAMAFGITNTDKAGSDITAFTADRESLETVLGNLRGNGFDPVAMEPDIVCLTRFFRHNLKLPQEVNPVFVILSQRACYIILPSTSGHAHQVRSFLVGPSQDKTALLTRQIPMTISTMGQADEQESVKSLFLTGSVEGLDLDGIGKATGLETQTIDLVQITKTDPTASFEGSSTENFAIATGAALAGASKVKKIDFRRDFSPFEGKKIIIQKALRLMSVSFMILMLTIGVYFQIEVFKKNKAISKNQEILKKEYSAAMFGKKPPPKEAISSKLKREYKHIYDIKSGQISGDDQSVSAKLTFVFEAINKAPANIDLNIDTISITSKTIRIIGNTNGRGSTLKLFESIKKHKKLKLASKSLKQAGGRDSFTITIE